MKQFNFARHWRKRIAPLLHKPDVALALDLGMARRHAGYRRGDPPWWYGLGRTNDQRVREGCLSWYQPWGECHSIAPFCYALGRELYPALEWGLVSGVHHTVAVGYRERWEQPEWVLDILLFRTMTAAESLEFATREEPEFFPDHWSYIDARLGPAADSFELFRRVVRVDGQSVSSATPQGGEGRVLDRYLAHRRKSRERREARKLTKGESKRLSGEPGFP